MSELAVNLVIVSRLLMGVMFVLFAIRNIGNIPRFIGILEGHNIPLPRPVIIVGIALQFLGGLLTAVGPFPAVGATLMIVFLGLATVLFHPMWRYSGADRYPHTTATLINTALCGGFLLLIAVSV